MLLFKEESNVKQIAAERKQPYPSILKEGSLDGSGKIHLVASNEVICSSSCSLVEASLGLMAIFYVFMFEYPPGLGHFFIYLQKCVLNIGDGKKLPKTIIDFMNSLHTKSKVE